MHPRSAPSDGAPRATGSGLGELVRPAERAFTSRWGNDRARVVHLLSGLEVGGKERVALRLARQGLEEGERHELWLFDTPYRSPDIDLDPTPVPTRFLPRCPGWDARFVRTLARHIRVHRVSAIHAHNDTALCYAAFASTLAGRQRPRLIATFHTWPTHSTVGARLSTRLAAARADAVAAVSDDLARRLVAAGWVSRCGTIWNGVDLDEFAPNGHDGGWHARLGIARDRPMVVHLARLDPIKRHVDVIEAARVLHASHPEVVFVLAGDGPLLSEMRRRASALPFVRFLGNVRATAPLLRSASVFILPSLDEAAPLALLEAMACGRPCICTEVGGIPAMLGVQGGHPAGLLVPACNPRELADAIRWLLDDAGRRTEFGRRARAQAEQFAFRRQWETYRHLYCAT